MEAESGRDTDRRLLDALLPLSPPPRRPLRPAARLYSAQHLHWVLGRERSRADRTGQEFSLVMLSAAAEGATARRVMHRLARVLAGRARATDEVGHFDETRLCAVLPGTNALGAASFARDLDRFI